MTRKKHRVFDPIESLNELIGALERNTGIRVSESGVECQVLIDRAGAASAEFVRGLLALHQAEGHSSGVQVLLEDFERVTRRAARLAAEHGAPTAPQAGYMGRESSYGEAEHLIGSQCSNANDGDGQE